MKASEGALIRSCDVSIGYKFGRLTVQSEPFKVNGRIAFTCRCSCGSVVDIKSDNLRRGKTKSCGCLWRPHGMSGSRVYSIWQGMLQRCHDKNFPSYHNYGGRGIFVCKEWRDSPIKFISWAKQNGYEDKFQIDRIDNDKGYYPKNCRWVTCKENRANTKNSKIFNIEGLEFQSSTDAARHFNVSRTSIHRWCKGYTKKGNVYPPREGCSCRPRYGEQSTKIDAGEALGYALVSA